MNSKADIPCGFQGADPNSVEIIWYIARQNSRVMTVPANDIITPTNGLQWVLDVLSGDTNSRNSRLIVGPVGEEHDQSTYQCSIGLPGDAMINSAIATLTVTGMIIIIMYYEFENTVVIIYIYCTYVRRSTSTTYYHSRTNCW